jgi:F-type H+-transporting ATPase subunit delta
MAKVTTSELARYIADELKAGKDQARLTKHIAAYLVSERRSKELGAIMRKVTAIREQEQGILEATVTTAHPLSVSTKAHIKSLLGKKVVLNDVLDPSVVGGVRIETAERGIDVTVEHQLKQLKRLTGVNI